MEVAFDSRLGEIFVANYGSNTVSVISDSNNTVIANINVGSSPESVAYDSANGLIFVTNQYPGTVSVISDSNNTVIANVTVGAFPSGIAYDSGKGKIFVANSDSGTVSVISDALGKTASEFGTVALFIVLSAVILVIVTIYAIVWTIKKFKKKT